MSDRPLLGMTVEEMEDAMRARGLATFRGRQLARWIYLRRAADFEEMTDLSKDLRARLSRDLTITDVRELGRWVGSGGAATKYLVGMGDGSAVESVLMRYDYGYSICLSTQVGCAFACPFCASGAEGLHRDLTGAEIIGQWYLAQRRLDERGERISRLVYMGSGEPLDNYENVLDSMRLFHSSGGPGIGYRRMTISTVGIVPGIRRLASEDIPITLAISLHAPNDYLRNRLVPANRTYPLAEVLAAAAEYARDSGRRLTFEYAMIKDVNDHPDLARELGILLADMPCHVNLIPFNAVEECPWEPSDRQAIDTFQRLLSMAGIGVTVRRSLGSDIGGACGQLRRRFGED